METLVQPALINRISSYFDNSPKSRNGSIGIDEPISMTSGGDIYYYSFDGLGSVTEITDNTESLIEKYSYSAFGKPTIKDGLDNVLTESAIGNRYLYTARELDFETGNYYYRARYYDSQLGRFLSEDPILSPRVDKKNNKHGLSLFWFAPALVISPSRLHPYNYVRNNPINLKDPLGLLDVDVVLWFCKIDHQEPASEPCWKYCIYACTRPDSAIVESYRRKVFKGTPCIDWIFISLSIY